MPYTDDIAELAPWIRLTIEHGIGHITARRLLTEFGLPHHIFEASYAQLNRVVSARLARQLSSPPTMAVRELIDKTLAWASEPNHHILTLADERYPQSLLQTYDPPAILYADGRIEALSRTIIGIVGSRDATLNGMITARQFARALAGQGLCIISGLAKGIDLAAHQGALQALEHNPVPTIAVMATGINRVYPGTHVDIARQMRKNGLLLSEFPLDTRANKYHFPRRNRIVAGLASGVLVVEAAKKSGSLLTARMAADLNKEVFAIPGSIHSPFTKGCHQLIRNGAKLVETTSDILEELHIEVRQLPESAGDTPESAAPAPQPPLPESAQTLLKAMDYVPWHPDDLTQALKRPIEELTADLSLLEMSGCVHRLEDGRYQRLPGSGSEEEPEED